MSAPSDNLNITFLTGVRTNASIESIRKATALSSSTRPDVVRPDLARFSPQRIRGSYPLCGLDSRLRSDGNCIPRCPIRSWTETPFQGEAPLRQGSFRNELRSQRTPDQPQSDSVAEARHIAVRPHRHRQFSLLRDARLGLGSLRAMQRSGRSIVDIAPRRQRNRHHALWGSASLLASRSMLK